MDIKKEIEQLINKIEELQEQIIFIDPTFIWLAEAKFYLKKVLENVS